MNISQFEVLATDLLDLKVKEKILADLIGVKGDPAKLRLPENFSAKPIDHYGKVYIISYRGVEVLLIFKRMTSKLTTLPLEVSPQAYLKNPEEAWMVFKLMDLYPGTSLGERIAQLEEENNKKDGLIQSLSFQLEQNDLLVEELMLKRRKKDKKTFVPPPPVVLMESLRIRDWLQRLKPLKINSYVRNCFLSWQTPIAGFSSVTPPKGYERDIKGKRNKRYYLLQRKLMKLEKMWKQDKQYKDLLVPYIAPPVKDIKKKVVKKVVKKKGSKKP